MDERFAATTDATAAVDRLAAAIAAAADEVVLLVPRVVFERVSETLIGARDRGALVVALVGNADDLALADATTVCREWAVAETGLAIATVDGATAMVASPGFLAGDRAGRAVFVDDDLVEDLAFSSYFGNFWPVARHVHTTAPAALPRTFEDFRHATVQAALHLREGHDLHATAWTTAAENYPEQTSVADGATVEGRVVNVRQSVAQPVTSAFPLENSVEVATESGRATVGGPGAFVEDYAANRLRLEHRD